jgi:hypothetical protein
MDDGDRTADHEQGNYETSRKYPTTAPARTITVRKYPTAAPARTITVLLRVHGDESPVFVYEATSGFLGRNLRSRVINGGLTGVPRSVIHKRSLYFIPFQMGVHNILTINLQQLA